MICQFTRIRRGFTMIELLASVTMLAAVLSVVAQMAYSSMQERGRSSARQAAVEAAANVLEAARAAPWESLNEDWASKQKLADLGEPFAEQKLLVRVATDEKIPGIKRVTAQVRFVPPPSQPEVMIEMTALIGLRTLPVKGDRP